MIPVSLHVVVEHGEAQEPYGCAYIRDILPLTHPVNQRFFRVTHGPDVRKAEIVIVERTWKPAVTLAEAENLVARVRRQGSRLVYSLDDNLIDLAPLPEETRAVVRLFCREADGIIVATSVLAERVRRLNSCVRLVPNAIDERLHFSDEAHPPQRPPERLVIGYMGTFTHDRDLMLVLQPLREILRLWPDRVELQIVGALADRKLMLAFEGLPAALVQVPGPDASQPAVGRRRRPPGGYRLQPLQVRHQVPRLRGAGRAGNLQQGPRVRRDGGAPPHGPPGRRDTVRLGRCAHHAPRGRRAAPAPRRSRGDRGQVAALTGRLREMLARCDPGDRLRARRGLSLAGRAPGIAAAR